MTCPYPRFKNVTFLLTRNCADRRFLIRPSEERKNAFLYCVARAQLRFPVQIHGFVFMSNHIHFVITDTTGNKGVRFLNLLDSLVARYLNTVEHSRGCVWDGVQDPNWCTLLNRHVSMQKLVYTLVNPVAAGLVPKHNIWPGAISTVSMIEKGGMITTQPTKFFDQKKNRHLKYLPLKITPLPETDAATVEEYVAILKRFVRREEHRIQKEMKEKNRDFLGAAKVLSAPLDRKPATVREGFGVRPKMAGTKTEMKKWIDQYRWFQDRYRAARAQVKSGIPDVVFPKGTYMMHTVWGFPVNPLGYDELVLSHPMNG